MFNNNYRIYYIYLITNKINNKTYVGQRKCPLDKTPYTDKYMGSGINIVRAEHKYGIENFTKEILAICHNEDELNTLEILYISLYKSINKAEYNISSGGDGGNTYAYKTEEEMKRLKKIRSENLKGHIVSKETREKISKSLKGKPSKNKGRRYKLDYFWVTNGCENKFVKVIPKGFRKGRVTGKCWNKGIPNTYETRLKISKKNKSLRWFNNGVKSVFCKECPKGYVSGRILNSKSTKGYKWYTNGIQMVLKINYQKNVQMAIN